HSTFVPEKQAHLAMERIDRTSAINIQKSFDPGTNTLLNFSNFWGIRGRPFSDLASQVIRPRVRQNEIAIRQASHQTAGAEPRGAVIGKIRFADYKQSRDIAH